MQICRFEVLFFFFFFFVVVLGEITFDFIDVAICDKLHYVETIFHIHQLQITSGNLF